MNEHKVAVVQTLRRLGHAIMVFLKSPVGGKAKLLAACLLILMFTIIGMNVLNSYVGRDFLSAIEKKDARGFVFYAWMYVAVFAGSTLVAACFRFSEERLGLLWRDYLTRRIVGAYIDRRIYLYFEHSGAITNPDQRMTEDVRQLTTATLSFVLMILNGTLTAISFSGVLWTISPKLFVIAVLYAAAGSVLTIRLGRPLIRLNYQQSDFEANFRSELIRVRENADGIALTGNESRIRDRLLTRIDDLVENLKRIIRVNLHLNFFTGGYNYMIQLIPTLIVAPLFMRQGVEFGVIGQAGMAFATLLGAFSLVITQFQAISSYASVITRLGEFVGAYEKTTLRDKASGIGYSTGADHFACSELTLRSADDGGKVLVRNLNVSFVSGKRVLVHGSNQAARVALFQAAAGLHDTGAGKIVCPPPEKLVFLPEQPYLVPSTLRELVVPSGKGGVTDDEIAGVLREAGLEAAVKKHGGLDTERNWLEVLSFEEQQRLSIARAVLARPDFVFLAQLDSALGNLEQERYLRMFSNHGITYVSFGDRGPDPALYDAFLELNEDGSWTWTDIRQA
jgi:vitamin B12/bleomycin/antimicrobial peptide transport system ATP-binding/permease protein